MGLALSGVGYDDALFVDNGAYTRVRTIARAIERNETLANAYKAGGLNSPVIRKFLTDAVGARLDEIRSLEGVGGAGGLTKAQRKALGTKRDQAFWENLRASGKASSPRYVKVSQAARQQIANLMGVGAAYARAAARKSAAFQATVTQKASVFPKVKGQKLAANEKFAFIADRDARVAARRAAWSGAIPNDVVTKAEARRAAARAKLGKDWQKSAEGKAMARGVRVTREDRIAALSRGLESGRPYGPYVRSNERKASTANKRAASGAGSAGAFRGMEEQLKQHGIFLTTKGQPYVRKANGQAKFISHAEAHKAIGARANPWSSNPFGSLSADDFGAVALSNPVLVGGGSTEGTGIALFDGLEERASNVELFGLPVGRYALGPVVSLAAPITIGGAAAAAHLWLVPRVMDHLPERVRPFAYTAAGSVVGIGAGALASTKMMHANPQARAATQLFGGAAALIGVGIDLYRHFSGRSSDTAGLALSGEMGESDDDEGEFGGLALSGDFAGLALGGLALSGDLGDGGAYQIQPVSATGAFGAVQAHYSDAQFGDASVCGPDLSPAEGEAVLAGPGAFFGTFGQTPQSTMRVSNGTSRHAGRAGHRWGWLIKLVGWEEFQRITALPAQERMAVIEQMKQAAIAAASGAIAKQQARMLASHPIEAPEALAPRGINPDYANADAFGALMVTGPGGL